MDGKMATKQIRERARGDGPIIIALTASSFEEERVEILETGCDDYIRKPYKEEEIFEMLSSHLGVRFEYKEEMAVAPEPDLTGVPELTSTDLAALPSPWVSEMHQVALSGLEDQMRELIGQIKADHPQLAQTLTRLVDTIRYDRITQVTEAMVAAQAKRNKDND